MLLPFAFIVIAVFLVLAIILIVRKTKGKDERRKGV